MILIKISQDYTEEPGPRFIYEGEFSGQDFREKFLEPKFEEALQLKEKLYIDLDGGYGYGTSFLEEAFGGLVRKYSDSKLVKENIVLVTKDAPELIDKINEYIDEALDK